MWRKAYFCIVLKKQKRMRKYLLVALLFALCGMVNAKNRAEAVVNNPKAVVALANRIGGAGTAKKFCFVLDPSLNAEQEVFVIGTKGKKVLIKGSTLSAITTGLGWYLNNYAQVNIAWNSLNEKTATGEAYADLSTLSEFQAIFT